MTTIHCTDGDLIESPSCFVKETLITLSDGSKKPIEDITYEDTLKVWNFDEGKYDIAKPIWITRAGLKNDHYYKLTFSDGTVLKTTGENSNHKIYSIDEHYFKGVDKIQVGDRIYSENGEVTVTEKEYIEEDVEYYNLITSKHFNCFANGILASDRYNNMYQIDDNMTYIKDERTIRTYDEFEHAGIERYWYENLRLGEQLDSIEEIVKYINKCRIQMLPIEGSIN